MSTTAPFTGDMKLDFNTNVLTLLRSILEDIREIITIINEPETNVNVLVTRYSTGVSDDIFLPIN
jgi:hypothetical protein